jgi:hypothetical protein
VPYSIATDDSTDVKDLFVFEVLMRTLNRWRRFLELVVIKGKIGADEILS